MALTKKDLVLIREELRPEFNNLRNDMEKGFKGVYAAMQGLKIYMETRFRELEHTMERKHSNHEVRIQNIEEKLEITSG